MFAYLVVPLVSIASVASALAWVLNSVGTMSILF